MSAAAEIEPSTRPYGRLSWLPWITYFWGLGFGIWALWLIVQTVLNCLHGAQVQLDLPISQQAQPWAGQSSYGGTAYVVQHTTVTYTRASMLVSHVPVQNVIFLGLGQIFASATSSVIAWCVYVLVRKLRHDEPFAEATARALVIAGVVLAVGSLASSISTVIGQLGLSVAFNPKSGNLIMFSGSDPLIQFTPLIVAAVLIALSGVFRYGARIERERLELKRETEGLV
jgi:hypothetical protein